MHVQKFEEYCRSGILESEFRSIDVLLQRVIQENFSDDEYLEFLTELIEQDGELNLVDVDLVRENVKSGLGRFMMLNEEEEKVNKNILQGCNVLSSQNSCVEYVVVSAGKPKSKAEKIGKKINNFSEKAEENINKINGTFGKLVKFVGKKMGLNEGYELYEFEMTSYPIMNQKTSFLALCLFAVLNFGFLFSALLTGIALTGGLIGIIGLILTAIVLLFKRAKIRKSLHGIVGSISSNDSDVPPQFHRTLGRMSSYGHNNINKPRKSVIGSGSTTGVLQNKNRDTEHRQRNKRRTRQ